MFSRILIANRGEVAVRIIRACKEMGIETVAVYSEADKDALHAEMADASYCIGGPLVKDSYLNIDAIITVAKKTGAEAVHPGYGMLSENPAFAAACEKEGLVFIGPSSTVMEKMGQKEVARSIAMKCDVPVASGSGILKDADDAKKQAKYAFSHEVVFLVSYKDILFLQFAQAVQVLSLKMRIFTKT